MTDSLPSSSASAAAFDAPFDAALFKRDHRLHIKDGALFTQDHHLMVNPDELHPENEPRLLEKVLRHYRIQTPSFFAHGARAAVALNLASLIPVSNEAQKQVLMQQMEKLQQADLKGEHPDITERKEQEATPFSSYVSHHLKEHPQDAVSREVLSNAISLYLLVGEALTRGGRHQEAAAYVNKPSSPDRVVAELAGKLGISAEAIKQAAHQGGVAAIGTLLHLEPALVQEVQAVSQLATSQQGSANMIESWQTARHLPQLATASLDAKIRAGTMVRASHTIESLRAQALGMKTPADVEALQDRLVATLRQMPIEIQEALYYNQTEIAATPAGNVSDIFGENVTALGLHFHPELTPGNHDGIRQIYISGTDSTAHADRVLHHEANHLVFPKALSAADLKAMDDLIKSSATRLKGLNALCEAWRVATPEQRKSVEAEIAERYQIKDVSLTQALGGTITEAGMMRLADVVNQACNNLDPNSAVLSKAYPTVTHRASEIISRYSEIKFVELRDAPQLLRFVSPQLDVLYRDHYLPHIRTELAAMKARHAAPIATADAPLKLTDLAAGKLGGSDHTGFSDVIDSKPQAKVDAASLSLQESAMLPASVAQEIRRQQGIECFADRISSEATPALAR